MANQKSAASLRDEAEPPEAPRPTPYPAPKPHLDLVFPAEETAVCLKIGLKSLQQERLLYKQRLINGRPNNACNQPGWLSERTDFLQEGMRHDAEREEEERTERVPPFVRRREHSKTAFELQSLPTQILLLSQDSELPRQCPSPIQPPPKRLMHPVSSHISPVKQRTKASNWSPVKTHKGARKDLNAVPLASWLSRKVHSSRAK